MSRSLFRKKSIDKIIKDAEEGLAESHEPGGLHRILTVRDLTLMGIAAIVGAGIFSTIGTAAFNGGPGISLLFVINYKNVHKLLNHPVCRHPFSSWCTSNFTSKTFSLVGPKGKKSNFQKVLQIC